jgi:hypothetical protein
MVTKGEPVGKANEQREEEIRMLDSIAETAVTSAMKAFAEIYPSNTSRRMEELRG